MQSKKTIHKSFRLSKEMLKDIKRVAKKEDITPSELIRKAIYYYVY